VVFVRGGKDFGLVCREEMLLQWSLDTRGSLEELDVVVGDRFASPLQVLYSLPH